MGECTCNQQFRGGEDYRDHLPCQGTPEQREIRQLRARSGTPVSDAFREWVKKPENAQQFAEQGNALAGALRLVAVPDLNTKAITHLQSMRRAPKMYFGCREALLASVTHLVAFVDDGFDTRDFYATHAGTHGNCYNDMSVPVEDDWAHKTIDAAIARLTSNSGAGSESSDSPSGR